MKTLYLSALLAIPAAAAATPADPARWHAEAARVTITRDDWGIAHVHGRSDADAVFGATYAQAEDDFPRIEQNYLVALGRTAEAEGETAIWRDLRQRLWIDPAKLQADYAASPAWLRVLMDAWADGLNFYLATHPDVHPKVLTRFEPWMALSFTEGSIGGDIERVDLAKLAAFYGGKVPELALEHDERLRGEPKGSNGIAIAPKLTRNGHALLLINPHTSFFFRSELGIESDAGLHAYGASTWGQFFLYQGWNEHVGWMHTSSGVDSVDEFAETVDRSPTARMEPPGYVYGGRRIAFAGKPVEIRYRRPDGTLASHLFVTWHSRHGPIVRADGDKWISMALMNRPVPALEQSWLRTKATSFAAYMKVAALQANSSNDTLLASREGTIAYLHPQFVPVRSDRFDYRRPVDGSDPATDWHGLTPLARLPQAIDPRGGWAYNSNDEPWRAAGVDSPRAADFPRYMDMAGPSPRGDHATALLATAHDLTPEGLRDIAFDPWMPLFPPAIADLRRAFDALPPSAPERASLAGPVALLAGWDARWSAASEPTTLANYWGEQLWAAAGPRKGTDRNIYQAVAALSPADKLAALTRAVAAMQAAWSGWRVPWGRVNCFQRLDDAITPHFDDAGPCTPVPFASARWGSLASFGAKPYPGTRRWYGTSGNSFVAIVEFGPRVHAMAVTAGGESGRPRSPHFTDEAKRYASGQLRPVYFYADELKGHTERTYHPGG
jgi:acyl-homoserine-lactone acylase